LEERGARADLRREGKRHPRGGQGYEHGVGLTALDPDDALPHEVADITHYHEVARHGATDAVAVLATAGPDALGAPPHHGAEPVPLRLRGRALPLTAAGFCQLERVLVTPLRER